LEKIITLAAINITVAAVKVPVSSNRIRIEIGVSLTEVRVHSSKKDMCGKDSHAIYISRERENSTIAEVEKGLRIYSGGALIINHIKIIHFIWHTILLIST